MGGTDKNGAPYLVMKPSARGVRSAALTPDSGVAMQVKVLQPTFFTRSTQALFQAGETLIEKHCAKREDDRRAHKQEKDLFSHRPKRFQARIALRRL